MTFHRSTLLKFFIFNPLKFGLTEETEEEKALYFWPPDTDTDSKMNDIGLCEALITFSKEFSKVPTSSARTERMMYLLIEPEKGWWMVMVMNNPKVVTISTDKNNNTNEEVKYRHDDLDEKALLSALKRVYLQFKIFNGPFEHVLSAFKDDIRPKLANWFNESIPKHLSEIERADIFTSLDGIHFLPVDKNVYLRIQSCINETEKTFDQILYSTFMYKNYLVWSGLEQEEMRGIYRYVEELFKKESSSTKKVDGGFATPVGGDKDSDDFTASKAKKMYLGTDSRHCYLLIYQLMDCSCAFLVASKSNSPINPQFTSQLEKLIKPQINYLAPIIAEHAKGLTTGQEFRYLYFNHMNLALKTSSFERDTISNEISRVLNKMHADFERSPNLSEILINTQNDGWVVGRKSDQREFFILFDKQNANLIEINEEVKKLVNAYFKDIFID